MGSIYSLCPVMCVVKLSLLKKVIKKSVGRLYRTMAAEADHVVENSRNPDGSKSIDQNIMSILMSYFWIDCPGLHPDRRGKFYSSAIMIPMVVSLHYLKDNDCVFDNFSEVLIFPDGKYEVTKIFVGNGSQFERCKAMEERI